MDPAALLDDPIDGRQPEAGALFHLLGREVGFEDPVADGGIDPDPGVGYRQLDTELLRVAALREVCSPTT